VFPPAASGFESITLTHAYFAVVMFAAGFNAKGLGVCIVAALGLLSAGANTDAANFVFFIFVPAYLASTFRN
jgi:hypothetical protein